MTETQVRGAIGALNRKIEELTAQRRAIAYEGEDGSTFRCDVLSSRIATLEEAIAILNGEVDA